MKSIQKLFEESFIKLGLPCELAEVSLSQRPDLCDYQINGALPAAKILKQSPMIIAQEILNNLPDVSKYISYSIVSPGFINLKLTDNFLISKLSNLLEVKSESPKKILIDFSSPNVAKAMHVGHLRSTLIGDALVRMHRYAGNTVVADNHIGDFGTPLGIVVTKIQQDLNFQWNLAYIESAYIQGSIEYKNEANKEFQQKVKENTIKIQQKDPIVYSIWKKLLDTTISSLKEDYGKLDINFDTWDGESVFAPMIPEMIESLKKIGLANISNGALVVQLPEPLPPLILEKESGGYLYHTTDLACIKNRSEMNYDQILYVVDNRQSVHFKQLFLVAEMANLLKPEQLPVHIGFGTINGKDNKPFKTRSGGVLKLSDLIDQSLIEAKNKMPTNFTEEEEKFNIPIIGIGALKFSELKHNRASDYVFDLPKFMELEGFTGPYVMYATVRAKSILQKSGETGKLKDSIHSESERSLILKLIQFNKAFYQALDNNEPHHLCEYSYQLASAFNGFYTNNQILKEVNPDSKSHYIALVELTSKALSTTLDILGIKVPTKM